MSIEPKISIIIPVYNMERYLRECLDSVLKQTLKDIEAIVINDGSKDKSIEIIREYENKDTRIVVIDKENEGVGKARNDGLHAAKGEFIAFLDSDDFYPDEYVLEKLYNAAKGNNVKIAGGTYLRLMEDGSLKPRFAELEEYGMHFKALGISAYRDYQYDYGYTTYIYNRLMLEEMKLEFPLYSRFQDPPFFVQAMLKAGRFFRIADPVYEYRAVSSHTKFTAKKILDMMQGLEDNLVFSRREGLAKLHCVTANRLSNEVSYMMIKDLEDEHSDEMIAAYLQVLKQIDTEWLKKEGYSLPEPFVPELFNYLRNATVKYERLRNRKVLKILSKFTKK